MSTVTLKLYAREGLLYDPTRARAMGQDPPYIGRSKVMVDGAASWPAVQEPYTIKLELHRQEHRNALQRLRKHAQKGALWAANKETAKELLVQHVEVTFADGAWTEKSPPPKPASPAPAGASAAGADSNKKGKK